MGSKFPPTSGRVPTAQGNRENGNNNKSCEGKHMEFGNFAKTQGILCAQVVNSLILKVKNILVFAMNIFQILFEAG